MKTVENALIQKKAPYEVIIELQDILSRVRDAEVKLAEVTQEYIMFITQQVINYES